MAISAINSSDWAVMSAIVIYTITFLVSVGLTKCSGLVGCSGAFFLGPEDETILSIGGLEQSRVLKEDNQTWRLLTAMWLHSGAVQYVMDVGSLLWSRVALEENLKSKMVAVVFVSGGIAGGVSSLVFVRNGVYVGAAGPLSGLNGAMLVHAIVKRHTYKRQWLAIGWPIVNVLCQVLLGKFAHVNTVCVLAGFCCGVFIAIAWLCENEWIRGIAAILAIVPILAGLGMVISGTDIYDFRMGGLTKHKPNLVAPGGPAPAPVPACDAPDLY